MSAPLSSAQAAILAGQIELCRAFGIGGAVWLRQRPATDSDDGSGATQLGEPIQLAGYVRRQKPAAIVLSLAGAPVSTGADRWRFYDFSAQDIQPGDLITSAADPALRYTIGPAETRAGFTPYAIEPIQ